jgi:hypothetical protein
MNGKSSTRSKQNLFVDFHQPKMNQIFIGFHLKSHRQFGRGRDEDSSAYRRSLMRVNNSE